MLQKLFAIFALQICLIALLFNYFIWTDFATPASYNLCMLAFLCCLVLHLYLQPTVFASIERMRYLFAHKDNFEQIFIPFSTCILKLICELSIEAVEVLTTYFLSYDELWVIMCYSAFTVIGYIDQQYFETMDDKVKSKFIYKYNLCLRI